MEKFTKNYDEVVATQNLLTAWEEFLVGKRKRRDVIIFQGQLMNNILQLQHSLKEKTYRHGGYQAFRVSDTKPRDIHKAGVADRILHHLLYSETYYYFDQKFIYDSYSCRLNKGTHRALRRLTKFSREVSNNNHKTVWILKCDIKKFFASIDHLILKNILAKNIEDQDLLWLFNQVIDSFNTVGKTGVGLPLGNLTSQLLVNIYMNEFDQFVKRKLNVKYYLRYADDFMFLSDDKKYLENLRSQLDEFLKQHLKLFMHPKKVSLTTLASGVDFLGWVNFSNHRVLRTITKRRMFKKLNKNKNALARSSYLGMLKHGNAHKLREKVILSNLVS